MNFSLWGVKMKRAFRVAILLALWLPVGETQAAGQTRYIDSTGIDSSNNCLLSSAPCQTITHALAQAANGDVLSIASGTYEENLLIDKSVTLRGSGAETTFIDGQDLYRVIDVVESATPPPGGTQVALEDLTVRKGAENGDGAGIRSAVASLRLERVRVKSNLSVAGKGGAIACQAGQITAEDVTVFANMAIAGGGVYIAPECTASLSRSTLFFNAAGNGGGMLVDGAASLTNVTVTMNGASDDSVDVGAGVAVGASGSLTTNHVTLAFGMLVNIGATSELRVAPGGKAYLTNTLIYGLDGQNCSGAASDLISLGYNLSDDDTCRLSAVGDLPETEPGLFGLIDNGGYTLTHELPLTSPAVDAGGPPGGSTPTADQRGMAHRDGDFDGQVRGDIGAFEYQPSTVWMPLVVR